MTDKSRTNPLQIFPFHLNLTAVIRKVVWRWRQFLGEIAKFAMTLFQILSGYPVPKTIKIS